MKSPARLIDIEISEGPVLRYQDFQAATYIYNDNEYLPLGLEMGDTQRTIDLDNEPSMAAVFNTAYLQGLRETYNGLRNSVVTLTTFYLESPDQLRVVERMEVDDSSLDESGLVRFTLKSPISSLEGSIVGSFFTSQAFPELPVTSR